MTSQAYTLIKIPKSSSNLCSSIDYSSIGSSGNPSSLANPVGCTLMRVPLPIDGSGGNDPGVVYDMQDKEYSIDLFSKYSPSTLVDHTLNNHRFSVRIHRLTNGVSDTYSTFVNKCAHDKDNPWIPFHFDLKDTSSNTLYFNPSYDAIYFYPEEIYFAGTSYGNRTGNSVYYIPLPTSLTERMIYNNKFPYPITPEGLVNDNAVLPFHMLYGFNRNVVDEHCDVLEISKNDTYFVLPKTYILCYHPDGGHLIEISPLSLLKYSTDGLPKLEQLIPYCNLTTYLDHDHDMTINFGVPISKHMSDSDFKTSKNSNLVSYADVLDVKYSTTDGAFGLLMYVDTYAHTNTYNGIYMSVLVNNDTNRSGKLVFYTDLHKLNGLNWYNDRVRSAILLEVPVNYTTGEVSLRVHYRITDSQITISGQWEIKHAFSLQPYTTAFELNMDNPNSQLHRQCRLYETTVPLAEGSNILFNRLDLPRFANHYLPNGSLISYCTLRTPQAWYINCERMSYRITHSDTVQYLPTFQHHLFDAVVWISTTSLPKPRVKTTDSPVVSGYIDYTNLMLELAINESKNTPDTVYKSLLKGRLESAVMTISNSHGESAKRMKVGEPHTSNVYQFSVSDRQKLSNLLSSNGVDVDGSITAIKKYDDEFSSITSRFKLIDGLLKILTDKLSVVNPIQPITKSKPDFIDLFNYVTPNSHFYQYNDFYLPFENVIDTIEVYEHHVSINSELGKEVRIFTTNNSKCLNSRYFAMISPFQINSEITYKLYNNYIPSITMNMLSSFHPIPITILGIDFILLDAGDGQDLHWLLLDTLIVAASNDPIKFLHSA